MTDQREVLAAPLPFLEDLLWEWVTIQERFLRLSNGTDALWWYNERTSLGALAGAVWRAGGVVLEEYSTEKLQRSRKGTSRATGRGDMDFALGGHKFVVEAKQCWPRLGTAKPIWRVKESLNAAKADVRRADVSREYLRLAVVFATPGSLKVDSLDLQLANWLHSARSLRRCACAWVFPEKGRNIHWPKTRRVYPGAAVFIRMIGKRKLPA